ncbi:MAG: GGDEF domain-containing protein [Xanthomonadaceae bacterium]|nr:GGDEF domain-containing protein [Xanthomonadaceae bacterium]
MLNRGAIHAEIARHVASGDGDANGFAVMAVNVRDLRQVAVRFGMERGEQAEASIGRQIRNALRPVDVVLQSGDEHFVAVLPRLGSTNHVLLAVARLLSAFEQPLAVAPGAPPWYARVAMGVALFPQDGGDADALWRHAQMAADDAMRRGDRYAFHDPLNARSSIDYHELRDSIESNRLATYFQPIRSLGQRRLAGVESLARWTSRTLGPVGPDHFVTFAERNNLIAPLTRWSIHATLRYASALRSLPGCRIALNLSPRALTRGGVAELLLDALKIWGVPPTAVVAEITETALAEDLDAVVRVLCQLRDHGVGVAIDDFGVGYASITYLSKFPATELKIDKSLVAHVGTDARMARLVESIIRFARHLGLETTAEGIEDEVMCVRLEEMGCEFGQGFHLGVPEPAAGFIARHGQDPVDGSSLEHPRDPASPSP